MQKINHALLFIILATPMMGGCASWKSTVKIYEEAKYYFEHDNSERGFQLLEKAMTMEPNSLEFANMYRAQIVKHNQEDRSISFFKKLVQNQNAPDNTYFNLAFAYIDKIPRVGPMGAGFLSKRSIAEFNKVLEKDPNNWIANYGIGMNYQHWPNYFKKNEGAISYFQKCIELQKGTDIKPYYILSYIRLGDAYIRSGETKKAIASWEEGLRSFPNHPDLDVRLQAGEHRIASIIQELYNPNNSIGTIDSDISILWAKDVPKQVVPLYAKVKSHGGGQLKTAKGEARHEAPVLFSWFHKNLPFLADKRFLSRVDMSPLGVIEGKETVDTNRIAHGMIMGFMSQFEGETVEQIKEKAFKMDGFLRPFYHEGLGMGLAASLDSDDSKSFQVFIKNMEDINPNFIRLHLAGAGMWFGLEASPKIEKIMSLFEGLGPFGAAYAYEGFGFAQVLFHLQNNPEITKIWEKLPPLASQSFYHGAGRAFWVMSGGDVESFNAKLEYIPRAYRKDAYSGYGMGASFTKATDPSFVFSYLSNIKSDQAGQTEFLTGVVMGYSIRYFGDPEYINGILASSSEGNQCHVSKALNVGKEAFESIDKMGGDFHSNWRSMIRKKVNVVLCK